MRLNGWLATTFVVTAMTGAAWLGPTAASAQTVTFNGNSQVTSTSPPGWDEPSGIAGADGQLYIASQSPNAGTGNPDTLVSQSTDGINWHDNSAYSKYLASRTEGQTGDVTMGADQAGTVFLGHLTGELQADIDYTRDGGKTWQTANDIATLASPGAASNSPGLVDRPWIGVYSPDTNYKDTRVYLEYHDFVTSAIYIVSCSMATGSLQCGTPAIVSNPQTACNSIPGGVAVSPPGSSHPGRVYTVWTTADPLTNAASGCNYTQLAPFYAMYVAWSDNPTDSGSWHQVPVYTGPNGSSENCPGTSPVMGVSTNTCADMSELFTPIAVDTAGNIYISFIDYIDTIDKHYDVYLERSLDGGNTWNGSTTGAGKPVMVSDAGGTHYTPNLVAGSAGRVALIYFRSSYATRPYESGDTCPTTVPPQTSCQGKNQPEPPSAQWTTEVALSTNADSSSPSFDQVQASDPGVVVHYGDICNLGIYCDGSSTGNRSLFENNTLFLNRSGYLVAGWSDQRLDPTGATDAASSNAQNLQVAHEEVFATTELAGPRLLSSQAKTISPPPCAQPSGRLTAGRLGPVALGMTRVNARRQFRHFSTRQRRFMDFFCLVPNGIRAGYPSPRLLRSLSARQRSRILGRVVLVLTASPYYSLGGVRPGTSLAAAQRVLRLRGPFHIGLNYWYVAPFRGGRGVLKVRHGVVEEIGITYANLTPSSYLRTFRFLKDFSNNAF